MIGLKVIIKQYKGKHLVGWKTFKIIKENKASYKLDGGRLISKDDLQLKNNYDFFWTFVVVERTNENISKIKEEYMEYKISVLEKVLDENEIDRNVLLNYVSRLEKK